jgi:phage shock protein A
MTLQDQEEKLTVSAQRLQSKVDTFHTRKETVKASYTAAEAQTRIAETVSGIGEEMGDVGMAVQRARDGTEQLQARAGALGELIDSGALEDATLPAGRDDIQAELETAIADQDVDAELARVKAELPASSSPRAVEGGDATRLQTPAEDESPTRAPPDGEATS